MPRSNRLMLASPKTLNFPLICLALVYFVLILALVVPAQEPANNQSNPPSNQKANEAAPPPVPLTSQLTETVIFLYEDKTPAGQTETVPGGILGTAFIVGIPDPAMPAEYIPLIVTAKHVIANRSAVLGRYSVTAGALPAFAKYDLEALRKDGDLWEYPGDEGVDIVVFRTPAYKEARFKVIPISLIATKDTYRSQNIDALDRVMIPCLMQNYPGVSQNYPILRDGSIALITQEPIEMSWVQDTKQIKTKQRVIFVNSTFNEGFSGAPVFLYPGIRLTPKGNEFGAKPWLLGIVHGFQRQLRKVIDLEGEDVFVIKKPQQDPISLRETKPQRQVLVVTQENSATGIIFPSWRLLEILESDAVNKRVKEILEENRKQRLRKS